MMPNLPTTPDTNLARGLPSEVPSGENVKVQYPFPIVGIGASAGGLEALRALFRDASEMSGISFIVVTHLDPTRKSLLAELLQKENSFTVCEVADLQSLQPNHVYVIPPNAVLTVREGRAHLSMPKLPRGFRDPINTLFTSLANELREYSLAIVLSGTGTDGVHGSEQVKKVGGKVFIQDPAEAAFSGMPESVAALGLADETAKLSELPHSIANWRDEFWPAVRPSAPAHAEPSISSGNVDRVITLLKEGTGHDFSSYRRGTLLRRLKARMEKLNVDSIANYLTVLESDSAERRMLIDELLINLTSFFRDPRAFQFLREEVFPGLLDQVDSSTRHLRVWVPACASGEEAYSLAILFFEEMERLNRRVRIHIFATDIDEDALEKARDGLYRPESMQGLSETQIEKFFVRAERGYRVSRKLRDVIVFAKHDLLKDAPLPKMLLVSCRNVFIYFDRDAQRRVINTSFAFSLLNRGKLFLGETESIPAQDDRWESITSTHPIYRHRRPNSNNDLTSRPRHGILSNGESTLLRSRPDQHSKNSPLSSLKQRVYDEILRVASPPMFVVDSTNRVVFCSERAKLFLRIGSGILETKFDNIVHPDVRWEIAHLLRTLRASDKSSLTMQGVRVPIDGGAHEYFDLEGNKLYRVESDLDLIAITASAARGESNGSTKEAIRRSNEDAANEDLARKNRLLEAELIRLRTSQTATISELENLNTELISSNEEFGTLNEELQAATEELETNREELQSINEELQSVNAELTLKVQQLSDSNDDLYNLLSCNDFLILLLDGECCLKRFTVQAAEILSLRESDLGRRVTELRLSLPVDLLTLCKQVLQTSNAVDREVQVPGGNWFNIRIQPYLRSDRGLDGLVITFINITEIKSYREALGRFQGRSKALVDSLPGNLLLCDENGVIQYCKGSRSSFRLFDPDSATGKRLEELVFHEININSEQLTKIGELAKQTITTRAEQGMELSVQIPRGPNLWFDVRLVACGTEGVLIFFHEITERKRLELELNRAVQIAELSSRAKTDFIANVSHELRTPLNAVIGFAQLLNRGGSAFDAKTSSDYVRRIEDSGRILLHLVNELLDLAQIDSGKLELQMTKTNVVAVVRDCLSLMAHQFSEKEQVCHVDLPVAPIEIFADEKRLKQVIINVLSNASKFSFMKSKIRVSTRIARQDRLTIEISDSGPGVPKEVLSSIFERFVRHVTSGSVSPSGSGLGLAISKSIIEAHGGTIAARLPGVEGKGLTVAIDLPMRTV